MSRPIDLVQWAPKVPSQWIKQLYEEDRQGLVDIELIDQVGWALYSRCETILQVTAAHNEGKITCPACDTVFYRNVESDVLACSCGWEVSWSDYHRTYQGRQLYAANAYDAFYEYVQEFPGLGDPQLKLLAIDQLLHKFHIQIKESKVVIGRPAACNLIRGGMKDVCMFLDALSSDNPAIAGSQSTWRETFSNADWSSNFPLHPDDKV